MQIQQNSIDREVGLKIAKGAGIAGTGAAALYVLSFMGQIEISNPVAASFMAWFVPVATNAVREWKKGHDLKKMLGE